MKFLMIYNSQYIPNYIEIEHSRIRVKNTDTNQSSAFTALSLVRSVCRNMWSSDKKSLTFATLNLLISEVQSAKL